MWKNHNKLQRTAEGRNIFLEALRLLGDNLVLSSIYAETAVTEAEASLVKAQRIRNVLYHPLASTARAALDAVKAIRNDRQRVGLAFFQIAVQLSADPSLVLDKATWGIADESDDEGSLGSVTEEDLDHPGKL
jgi:hypothetical protein